MSCRAAVCLVALPGSSTGKTDSAIHRSKHHIGQLYLFDNSLDVPGLVGRAYKKTRPVVGLHTCRESKTTVPLLQETNSCLIDTKHTQVRMQAEHRSHVHIPQ